MVCSQIVKRRSSLVRLSTSILWLAMHKTFLLQSLAEVCCIAGPAAQVSGPSSGKDIGSKYPIYNLTQLVDHGGNNTSTFNQRYQLVTDYFKPGGPILLIQGAESD
jgi:hypothetical protein